MEQDIKDFLYKNNISNYHSSNNIPLLCPEVYILEIDDYKDSVYAIDAKSRIKLITNIRKQELKQNLFDEEKMSTVNESESAGNKLHFHVSFKDNNIALHNDGLCINAFPAIWLVDILRSKIKNDPVEDLIVTQTGWYIGIINTQPKQVSSLC